MLRTTALATLLLWGLCLSCSPASAGVRELRLPVDPAEVGKHAFGSDPLVWVEPAEYKRLVAQYEARQKAALAVAPSAPPVESSAVEAVYKGKVAADGRSVRFNATLRYHVLSEAPQRLPVALDDVGLRTVTLIDAAGARPARLLAPQKDGAPVCALVDKKGPVTLELDFDLAVEAERGKSAFGFRPPDFSVKRLEALLPPTAVSPALAGEHPGAATARPVKDGVLLAADLGGTPLVKILWFTSGQAAREGGEAVAPARAATAAPVAEQPPRITASTASLFVVGEETLTGRHELQVLVTRGRAASVDLLVPAGFEVQEIAGPLVADWSAAATREGKTLRVALREPLRGETAIAVTGYQVLTASGRMPLPVPKVSGATRQQGVLGVSSFCTLELAPSEGDATGTQPIDPGDLPETLVAHSTTPILLAYRCPAGAAPMVLSVKRYPASGGLGAVFENANAVTILSETDADRARGSGRKVTSFTKVILQLVNASRKYVTVKLDPAARISSCFVGSESCSPGIGKVPGEFLLPVPRSRASQGKLDAFPVQLTYQLDLPNGFADSGTIRYGLPSFDVPVADYSWKVFTPDTYRFLKFRGDLEDTSEEAEFVLVAAAKWLFDRLLYDLAARLAALGALVGAVLWIVRVARRGFDGSTKASFVTRGSLGALAIVGIIVCGLAAIAVPNFRAARERSNTRACFANQKTIAGAVEMYNLDQNTCRKEIGVAFLQELAQQGYLQCVPDDPGCGPGSAANYFTISGGNGIACRAHGAIGEGGARVYGMEPSVPAAADPSAPAPVRASRDDRTNPINFRIPKTGQYTLLLRGFLPEGLTPSFEVRYYSAERYLQLRLLCWTVGAVLALLLVLPAAGRRSTVPDVALMAALLAALLGLDAQAPALAAESFGAWVTALGLGLPLVVFGARIERMMVRMEDGDAPPLGSIATKTLLSLLTIVALTPSVRAEDLEMRLFAPSARADASAALLMPRSDFKRLSAAAGAAVTAAATKADGLPGLLLEEASYRVVPSYPVSEVEARYRIWGHGSGWRSIELAGAGLDAAAAPEVVSGRAASVLSAGAPGRFLVDLEGSTEIRQRFSAPVAREGNRFRIEFAAPRSPINSLRLADLPAGFREFRVAGGVAGPDGSEFRFPAAERVRLEWTNAAPSPVQAAKPEETFETHSQIESSLWLAGHAAERVLRLEGRLDLEVSRRPVSRTVVELHPSLAVVDARAPELADWSIEPVPGSAAQRLVIEWKAPFAGRAQVQLMLEVSREGDAPFELGLPAVAGAQREHVTLGVSGQGNLLVEPGKLPDGVRQGDPSQPPQELSRPGARPLALLLTAARHGGSGAGAAAPVQLRVTRLQQVQLLAAVADLAEFSVHAARDGQLMGHGHWLVKNNSEQFLRLRMPEGARLLDCFVSGTAVTPAAGPSGELLLPLEKSGVRNTQAAAFPVDLGWLEVRKPLEEGATMRLTLPHVQLPVSTLRLKLGMPRDLDAVPVSTNLQADASYREVSYAGENGEREAEASGRRLFEQSAPPLKVPFPEMTQVENYSRDIVDPSGSAPFLETRIAARQTSRFNRSLGFSAALLLAFGFVLHGPTARSRKRRLAAVLVVSGVAVGVTSFRPESLALGLYFALGLFLGAALGLLRWLAELRPVSPALSPRFPPGN